MEYRQLGLTDMKVSHIALGASPIGGFIYGQVAADEGVRVVHQALDAGINLIDTAPWYGRSEQVLGQALSTIPRSKYFISTKIGRYTPEVDQMFDFSAQRTLDSVDNSLRTLGLDQLDIVQVHDVEFAESMDVIISETLPALQKLKDDGKTRYIGITGYPLETLKKVVESSPVKIDIVLSYCRLTLHDSSLLNYLEYFQNKGIGVINAAPSGMGLFTPQGPQQWHPAPPQIKSATSQALALCQERGVSLPALALHHAVSYTEVPTTLVGASNVQVLRANIDIATRCLTDTEAKVKEDIMQRFMKPLNNLSWEGIELEKYRRKLAALKNKAATQRNMIEN